MLSRLSEHIGDISSNEPLPIEFSPYVKNQTNNILKYGCNDQAVSRKNVEGITIDGIESLDLDDAIWAEKTKNGYCVWIHISDVAEYIDIFSPIDLEALKRTTSIYRSDSVIPMIPSELSNDRLSLYQSNNKVDKTMTLQIDLNDECIVTSYEFYESHFKNIKQYNYETFSEDYLNPEAKFYSQLNLLGEISDALRIQRIQKGGNFFMDEERRISLGHRSDKNRSPSIKRKAHDIIESLMVLANVTTGNHFLDNEDMIGVYKLHKDMQERSFYSQLSGVHAGLSMFNYTHFTSPIRRYIDLIIHRGIKSNLRGEPSLYKENDLHLITKQVNSTALRIDIERRMLGLEEKGIDFIQRTQKRLGRSLEVYDFKHFLRSGDKIPTCIQQQIIQGIESGDIGYWSWSIFPILVSGEKKLQDILYQKVIEEKSFSPNKILNILIHEHLFIDDISMFSMVELGENEKEYGIEFYFKGHLITSYSMSGKLGDYKEIKAKVQKKVVHKIFKYFQ